MRRLARRLAAPALLAAGLAALSLTGCGGSARGTVATDDPASAFAPVVHLHPGERFMPMSARWFLGRSVLGFAEDLGCEDRKIAVGRLLKAQQNDVTDWMFIEGIGRGPSYWREPYRDAKCDRYRDRYRYNANQLTRPHDDSPRRARDLEPGEGYYLDLMDWARPGPAASRDGGQATVAASGSWFERSPQEVDGEPGLRLTYWMLFGMNVPHGTGGRRLAALTHEGDWERVDVLLRGEGGEWEPAGVRLRDAGGRVRQLDWEDVRSVAAGARGGEGTGEATHPVLFAARGAHSLEPRQGVAISAVELGGGRVVRVRGVAAGPCPACARWETWRRLGPARKRLWYGFGGAWGAPGSTSATTGPLGPGGAFAKGELGSAPAGE